MQRAIDVARALRRGLRYAGSLRVLPRRVALFMWRADRAARRDDDRFSIDSAARPGEIAALLELARGRGAVVELGTGTAWTAIALALDDPRRRVITYDPVVRGERERYLALAGAAARARVDLRAEPDTNGPRAGDQPVEMLFIDSSHDRDSVREAFRTWRDALAPGAVVAFHDFDHPGWPGVREAIAEDLRLDGEVVGGLFVWRAP